MFNIYLGIYIVLAIAIVLGGSYKLYGMGMISAGIFFIGSLITCIIFGIKWFNNSDSLFSVAPVSWPPTINTCPDYLMYYGRKLSDGTTQDTCIDTIGVSRNGSLKLFPTGRDAPTSDDYYFSLLTKSSDPSAKNAELCQRAITNGLTWEGITNGESCIAPGGGTVAPASGGSSGCPTK
jgi:hypothetical protein